MAEPKKPDPKDFKTEMTGLLVALFLLSILIERLMRYFSGANWWEGIWGFLAFYMWPLIKVILILVGLAAAIGIFHVHRKLAALNREEWEMYGSPLAKPPAGAEAMEKNEKWERIIELINSPNSSDWRLAIIEADVMLEELLRKAGYDGDSIGEMLKAVDRSDFLTLEAAWEAHKIRNAVAHQGADYPLNEREAKHAVSLFESVFREFKII